MAEPESLMNMQFVGVDVGGTFTDFVFLRSDGNVTIMKCSSTQADPSSAVISGIRAAKDASVIKDGYSVIHGTTVATNSLLERCGAATALITTKGFRDVLEIGRQTRKSLYSFNPAKSIPLLGKALRHEVKERIDWRGEILTPIDEMEVRSLLDRLITEEIESVAVCFLFSYLNPVHEQFVGRIARERGFSVSLSSEIAPEPREYERASTTAANAFVAPVMSRYLLSLETGLIQAGASRLSVMQSNGGALSSREAASYAIKTVLSGPAGGIIAASAASEATGIKQIITFDMGGTSTDVALLNDGKCETVTASILDGMPLRTQALDIHTVGAGGGSIARLDSAGGLRVGPESAGSSPGPVAYGNGKNLTVTDANFLLGRLLPQLAGGIYLDKERVEVHFNRLAERLGCSREKAALGIIDVSETVMTQALRHISVERGMDPKEFTLLSFGGAGGLHACSLADLLGINQVLVPRYPGTFSALGLVLASTRRDYARAFPAAQLSDKTIPSMTEWLAPIYLEMEISASEDMLREGLSKEMWIGETTLDIRYTGQSYELSIPYRESLLDSKLAFHAEHQRRYGHSDPVEPVEITAARFLAVSRNNSPVPSYPLPMHNGIAIGETMICTELGWRRAALYRREDLAENQIIEDVALILQEDATTYLPGDWSARVDKLGNLILINIKKLPPEILHAKKGNHESALFSLISRFIGDEL